MSYTVIINQPGYMPEGEASEVATMEEAREMLLSELTYTYQVTSPETCPEEALKAAEALALTVGLNQGVALGRYVHTIMIAEA